MKLHPERIPQHLSALGAGNSCRPWLAALLLLAASLASAQDALRYSLAGDAAAEALRHQQESQPYTFKTRDFRLLVTPSLGLDWNDNINVSKIDPRQDFILKPMLRLNGSYPLTARNLLSLSVGVGYDQYFEHDDYSGIRLDTGSAIAFAIYVKDFRIDLHDRFQLRQDAAGQPGIAGTAAGRYGFFENTAGLSANWDLQDVILTLGYDHQNYFSSSSQYQYTDRASELIVARGGFKVHPTVTAGVEATSSFTAYDQPVLNNNVAYSAGLYADWQPGHYVSVQPRFGYIVYDFDQTSRFIPAVNQTAWYADLTLTHALSDAVSYSLSAGRELALGTYGDTIEDWYIRPNVSLRIVRNLALNTYLSYEHGTQGLGYISGNLAETYDWLGWGLGLSYPIMKKLTVGLNYRLTLRTSNSPSREYAQNVVGLQLTYRLQ